MAKKINITKTSAKRTVKEWTLMTIGVFLYAFAWTGIIIPAKGVGGGASGMALLIDYATNGAFPMGVGFFIINAILLIAAVIILGAKFGAKTLFCIILTSVAMSVMQRLIPAGSDILGIANDKLLSAVLGGACSGAGISLVLTQGGSTGGTDILAMIINKYRNISYGKVIMAVDFVIIGCSYFVFTTDQLPTIIYGYILTAAFSVTADALLAGNKQSSQIFIMSEHYTEIADMITNNLHRGVTILDGTGWYSKKPAKVLMVAVRKNESGYLLQQVKALDPKAFITMGSVMGVYGEGFDTYRK